VTQDLLARFYLTCRHGRHHGGAGQCGQHRHTLATAAALALAAGAASVDVAVTHALLAGDALQRFHQAGVSELRSTDSVPHSNNGVALASCWHGRPSEMWARIDLCADWFTAGEWTRAIPATAAKFTMDLVLKWFIPAQLKPVEKWQLRSSSMTLRTTPCWLRVRADRRRVCLWKEWVGESGAPGLQIFSFTIFKREIA